MNPAVLLRRRRLARTVVIATSLIVLGTGAYIPVSLTAPLPAASTQLSVPVLAQREPAVLALPQVGASAIALRGSDTVLGSSGSTAAVPIASVTKVITALVVLEERPLTLDDDGPGITMTAADVELLNQTRAIDGSYELVVDGQVLSERQVVEIMLLRSANNYSETLTNWAFGSLEAYLAAARTFLTAHDLGDTTVMDASGLDPRSSSSTADLMRIAALALENPVLAKIVSTTTDNVPEIGEIDNTNELLGHDGIDGIKTGTTDEAGSCLLFSAEFSVGDQTRSVVGVVLGAGSSQAVRDAVQALLASAKAGFTEVTLASRGDDFGSYRTPWGQTARIVAGKDADAVVWSDDPIAVSAETAPLTLGTPGTEVGDAAYTVAGTTVRIPLTLDGTLADPGFWWRLTNPAALFG